MKTVRFMRFVNFRDAQSIVEYCAREGITDYQVWEGPDGQPHGACRLPEKGLTEKVLLNPFTGKSR